MAEGCALTLSNRLSEIPDTLRRAEAFAAHQGVPRAAVTGLVLALEESLMNIVTHGYRDAKKHRIMVTLTVSEGEVRVELTDDGVPFDPRTLPPPDLARSQDDRPLGGLGAWLTKQLMDDVRYQREAAHNRLTLVKRWNEARTQSPKETHPEEAVPIRITREIFGTTTMFSIAGRLDATTAIELEAALMAAYHAGARRFLLDCPRLISINSAGLRTLLNLYKRMKPRNGILALSNLRPPIADIFALTGLNSIFPVHDNRAAALRALSSLAR